MVAVEQPKNSLPEREAESNARERRQWDRAEARVGTVLNGKWTLDALLGVGGMASVYAATHRNRKRAAIKLLHPEYSANEDIAERFLREGYVANSVNHPAAVRVDDDHIADDGSAYLVVELLEGSTIEEEAERAGGTLDVGEVLRIAVEALDVLACAHAQGVVHRDIKPENLFRTYDGVLKVLDFGIARLNEPTGGTTATRTGALLGTPNYMAPEQARGRWREVDAQTDLWAVAATMFDLLAGRPPHEGETANEVLALAITQPVQPIASVCPHLPDAICQVIDKGLAYDKKDRFGSASEMQAAVRSAYREISGVPSPPLGVRSAVKPAFNRTASPAASTAETLISANSSANVPQGTPGSLSSPKRRKVEWWFGGVLLGVLVVGALAFAATRGSVAPEGEASASPPRTASAPTPPSTKQVNEKTQLEKPARPAASATAPEGTKASASPAVDSSVTKPIRPPSSEAPRTPTRVKPSRPTPAKAAGKDRVKAKQLAAKADTSAAPAFDPFAARR